MRLAKRLKSNIARPPTHLTFGSGRRKIAGQQSTTGEDYV